ncbi:nodulation efficiency protein D [Clostridium sp. CAG:273]|nr:nodulation efficiency protein D [Clostridium sp. CAG:273]
MWPIWLVLAGIFFIVEIATTGFLVFWLGIGSLFAMITSFFTENLIIQMVVFITTSTLLIIFTKPVVKKFLIKDEDTVVTNVYSIIGKKAIVTKDINPTLGVGQIKVEGQDWSAKCDSDAIIVTVMLL